MTYHCFPLSTDEDDLDVSTIAGYINNYGAKAGQFIYNDKVFVSTFIGDGFDWRTTESQSKPLFACPNWQSGSLSSNNADCGFSWEPVRALCLSNNLSY